MTEASAETITDNSTFNVDDWAANSSEAILQNIKKQFLAIPDHLNAATQDESFSICLFNDIDDALKRLKLLNSDYNSVSVPDRSDKVRNILGSFHCENLSDLEPEVVSGFPELIILAYDLDGSSGEALFGVDGQEEVVSRLRSFEFSRTMADDPYGGTPSFNVEEWREQITKNLVSKIECHFRAILDHLYEATQGDFFSVCVFDDLDDDLKTLRSLNSDYVAVHVPDSKEKVPKLLHALHCNYLSDYDPEVVNGLPELIISGYDLEGKSGETLFGVEGQEAVLNMLRSFNYSGPAKTPIFKRATAVAGPVLITVVLISFFVGIGFLAGYYFFA